MANLEPITYQKMTNIEEHNQIIDKTNEIIDTINALDIEGIPTLESDVTTLKADVGQLKISDAENVADIAQAQKDISGHASEISAIKVKDVEQDGKIKTVETDITNIKANVLSNTNAITNINAKDVEQDGKINTVETDITNIKANVLSNTNAITNINAKDVEQDARITENGKIIDALTKELPTEITLYRDGTGKIRAQVEKEDSTTFDSNTLDMIIPYQYDIISGTTNRSFKLKVSFSDGSTATTNDFIIPDGGGTDVTVTGITLSKDANISNKFKASIVLSDSTTIDSGYLEMVTSVSATFTNKKLTIKVNGIESVPITIDTGITYTGGNGIIITGGTISIDSTVVALKSDIPDVSGFATKSELNTVKNEIPDVSGFATKSELNAVDNKVATKADSSTVQQIQTTLGDCFNDVSIVGNVLTLTATDGQNNSVTLPSGDEWKPCTTTNFDDYINKSALKVVYQWKASGVGQFIHGTIVIDDMAIAKRYTSWSSGELPFVILGGDTVVIPFAGTTTKYSIMSILLKYVSGEGDIADFGLYCERIDQNSINTITETKGTLVTPAVFNEEMYSPSGLSCTLYYKD